MIRIIKKILQAFKKGAKMRIEEIFSTYFIDFCEKTSIKNLSYVVTSRYRENGGPHGIEGNALDFTLRYKGEYAPIRFYNDLFKYFLINWPFRAGIDNTTGNIHIHIDLGEVMPKGQKMPYFFKEDNGKFLHRIKSEDDI